MPSSGTLRLFDSVLTLSVTAVTAKPGDFG